MNDDPGRRQFAPAEQEEEAPRLNGWAAGLREARLRAEENEHRGLGNPPQVAEPPLQLPLDELIDELLTASVNSELNEDQFREFAQRLIGRRQETLESVVDTFQRNLRIPSC